MTRAKGTLNYSSPLESEQRLCYARHKAQAKHRGELYTLTFQDFVSVWGNQFHRRGKSVDSLCMSRRNQTEGWTPDNVVIVSRQQHLVKFKSSPTSKQALDPWEIPDEIRHKL